jgi:hypothetical protein
MRADKPDEQAQGVVKHFISANAWTSIPIRLLFYVENR